MTEAIIRNVGEDGYGCAVCNLHWCSKQDVLEWLKRESTK